MNLRWAGVSGRGWTYGRLGQPLLDEYVMLSGGNGGSGGSDGSGGSGGSVVNGGNVIFEWEVLLGV